MKIVAAAVSVGVLAVAAACSSSSSSGSSGGTTSSGGNVATTLPNDSRTACLTPGTTAQDFPLPATGGVSGTLSVGAYAAGVTGCLGIKVTTGAGLTPASLSPLTLYTRDVLPAPRPILQIDVGAAFGADPVFGTASIVTGMSLDAPAINFPDGTYYMTITKQTTEGTRVQTITLTAANGVLTVAPLATNSVTGTTNQNSQLPQIVVANSTATLKLYARGVIPPDASDNIQSRTPNTFDVSDGGLPPPPDVTAPPTTPGSDGFPPPLVGTLIGYSRTNFPAPDCVGSEGCESVRTISSQQGATTPIYGVAGMYGTVTFEMSIAYMQIHTINIDCPSDWDVDVGLDGSGAITIPQSHPLGSKETCTIDFGTQVPGDNHNGFGFTAALRGLDIGFHSH